MILSWHNEPTLKAAALERLREHRRLDEIVQATFYWWDGQHGIRRQGCHLGCLTHRGSQGVGEPHASVERLFGIPIAIAEWLEFVFEDLPREMCTDWVLNSTEAIPVGADLGTLGTLEERLERLGCNYDTVKIEDFAARSLDLFRSAPVISAAPQIAPEVRAELCARNLWCDGPVAVHRECVQAGGRV